MGEDDVGLSHGRRGAGIPVTREHPVVDVEDVGVRRQRQSQQRDVGVCATTQRPLGTVECERHRERALVEIGSRNAVDVAHFPQKNRLSEQGLRGPDQLEGIEVLLIGTQTPILLREGADLLPSRGEVTHADVFVRGQLGIEDEPQPAGVEVVVKILDQQFPPGTDTRLAATADTEGVYPTQIGVRGALAGTRPETIESHLAGEDVGRDLIQLTQVQDVDRGITRHHRRVDHPEEPVGFEVQIAERTVLGFAGGRADGEVPFVDDATLLSGRQCLNLPRAYLEGGVDAEVVAGNLGGDEPGRRRLETHRAHLDPPDDLVFQSLVEHLNGVGGVDLPLRVPIDVDVDPLGDDAAGQGAEFGIEPGRLELGPAARVGPQGLSGCATLVLEPVGPELEPGLRVQTQIGIARIDPQQPLAPRGLVGRVRNRKRHAPVKL